MKRQILSLDQAGFKAKMRIVFYLISVLPFLICLLIIFKNPQLLTLSKIEAVFLLSLAVIFIFIGLVILTNIAGRLLRLSKQAKSSLSQAGLLSSDQSKDELGSVEHSLKAIGQKLKNIASPQDSKSVCGLGKDYPKPNFSLEDIYLTSVSSGQIKEKDIVELVLKESLQTLPIQFAYFLKADEEQSSFKEFLSWDKNGVFKADCNIAAEDLMGKNFLEKDLPFRIDANSSAEDNLIRYGQQKFQLKNILLQPIQTKEYQIGLLVVGNNKENFAWSEDDVCRFRTISAKLALFLGCSRLQVEVEKLQIRDSLTGLYNEAYIRNRLQEEIKRAIFSQRPCGFVLLNIDNFQRARSSFSPQQTKSVLKKIAALILNSTGDIDCVGRFGDNDFALILPEKNKRKSFEIAEHIRKQIEYAFSEEPVSFARLTISGGVSENPLDGITSEELILRAKYLLSLAKTEGKNRIKS